MPGGKKPGPSIKRPKVYEGLRRRGYTKRAAAAISNSMRKTRTGKTKTRTKSGMRTTSARKRTGSRRTRRNR